MKRLKASVTQHSKSLQTAAIDLNDRFS